MYGLSPTHLPVPNAENLIDNLDAARRARQLAGLGYPGFAHLRAERTNPAALMVQALVQQDLEVRLIEALPWISRGRCKRCRSVESEICASALIGRRDYSRTLAARPRRYALSRLDAER
jgi:hypothetical protein